MESDHFKLTVSAEIGTVSASYNIPANPICMLTFAHGAGAGMNHVFMTSLSDALASENIATLRFNFPFMENRKGRADLPAVAHKTIATAVDHVRETHPS